VPPTPRSRIGRAARALTGGGLFAGAAGLSPAALLASASRSRDTLPRRLPIRG
jgi:hypothetical protein